MNNTVISHFVKIYTNRHLVARRFKRKNKKPSTLKSILNSEQHPKKRNKRRQRRIYDITFVCDFFHIIHFYHDFPIPRLLSTSLPTQYHVLSPRTLKNPLKNKTINKKQNTKRERCQNNKISTKRTKLKKIKHKK